jgi:hypothetical protein
MLAVVLPQLIDRVGENGTATPGLFNDQAARILGQRSFDHDNKENRWRTFLALDSALAVEFRDEFERAKAINLAHRRAWADINKLHKRIMEERDEFRSQDLSQRAASLPITDQPPDGLLSKLERPVFKVSLQRLARPQCQLYEHTMEYEKCAAFRCPDSGTEGSRRQAPSVGLA